MRWVVTFAWLAVSVLLALALVRLVGFPSW